MAVMGLTEVVRHLPRIYGEFRRLKRAIAERRPAAAVLIDFPEFHFRLARELKRLGIPVIYFVSPQLWAWKAHRIKLVRKYVRRMMVIFPFEEPYYRQRGVAAEFVGHPLAELPPPAISREEFATWNGLDPEKAWIGLLPGSRMKEIEANLPELLKAARELTTVSGTSYEFAIPLAATLNEAQRAQVNRLVEAYGGGLAARLVEDARATLYHARASVVASGTATVEAALIGNPFVVVYRLSALTYAIAKRVVKVKYAAMVNLIAGKQAVPELLQRDFTAAKIVQHLKRLLPDGAERQSMKKELEQIRAALRARPEGHEESSAIGRVAAVVAEEAERARRNAGAAMRN
jgi:lipid-A-disaccharide synthase